MHQEKMTSHQGKNRRLSTTGSKSEEVVANYAFQFCALVDKSIWNPLPNKLHMYLDCLSSNIKYQLPLLTNLRNWTLVVRPFAKLQKDKNNLALDRPYTGGRSPDICHILSTHHPCHSSSTEASNHLLVAHAVPFECHFQVWEGATSILCIMVDLDSVC